MTERLGILAAGNWIVDRVKIIDRYPEEDQLARILDQTIANGGSPYNVLKDLARLQAPFPLAGLGLIGDDLDGESVLADCRAHGIDVTLLRKTGEAATSYTDVMTVQSTGRRTFFHHTGANSRLSPADFDLQSSSARIFHLAYLLLLDRLDAIGPDGEPAATGIFRSAQSLGFKTSADLVTERSGRFASVVAPSLRYIDYLFLNELEAEQLTGAEATRGREGLARAAQIAIERGVRELVCVHSPDGALARTSDGREYYQGRLRLPSDKVAGAVGAGDALAAGVLFGVHERWDLAPTLRLGVCAAASSLLHATSSEGVLPWHECLKLGEELGFA